MKVTHSAVTPQVITCQVSPRFFRRVWVFAGLFLALAGGFLYDAVAGHPTRNETGTGLVLLAAALAALMVGLVNRGKSLKADPEELICPDGRRIPYASVIAIDNTRRFRGQVRVIYEKGGGHRTWTLDEHKYPDSRAILERMKSANPAIEILGPDRALES